MAHKAGLPKRGQRTEKHNAKRSAPKSAPKKMAPKKRGRSSY